MSDFFANSFLIVLFLVCSVVQANTEAKPDQNYSHEGSQLNAKANTTAKSSLTISEQALRAIENGNLSRLAELIDSKKIAVDQVVQGHDSLLLVATAMQKPDVIRYLIKQSANLNFKNSAGETALFVAVSASDNQIANLLVDSGASLIEKSQDSKDTILHLAAMNDNVELVKLLLKKSPELVNQLNAGHETALHKAAYFGALRVIPVLLKAGINQNIQDKSGLTALDLARKNKLTAAQRLLQKK